MLVEFEDLARFCTSRTQLGHVYKSVFVQTYINEGSEIGYVGHYARKLHPALEIFDLVDVIRKGKVNCRLPRIPARLCQLLEYIQNGRQSGLSFHIVFCLDLLAKSLISNKFAGTYTKV